MADKEDAGKTPPPGPLWWSFSYVVMRSSEIETNKLRHISISKICLILIINKQQGVVEDVGQGVTLAATSKFRPQTAL